MVEHQGVVGLVTFAPEDLPLLLLGGLSVTISAAPVSADCFAMDRFTSWVLTTW